MKTYSIIVMLATLFIACTHKVNSNNMKETNETQVIIETTEGNIIVKLYDETPLHKENFLKLVKEGAYDSTLFHRVIKNFMIQAGDPQSKNASDTATLGGGDVGYTIPAEIVPALYHKQGALATARMGDDVNPQRASSGCQFYIVTGKVFTEAQLTNLENRMNEALRDTIFNRLVTPHRKEILLMRKEGDQAGLMQLQDSLEAEARRIVAEKPAVKFTAEQRKTYTTQGGTPHLDGAYTVFGEVVSGLDIALKIAEVETGAADRPKKDVRILKATVKE